MKRRPTITPAQKVIRRISELRDLGRRLARAGFVAGLHKHDPDKLPWENRVAESKGGYSARKPRK
ncbi:MAG TPA: hypothetical protein VMP11_11125 [Verrucomicrobiae bacterium]|nr:hypothetical protein [Verrucomicrobiae bacterium]